jgi:hypothetical protein
MTRNHDSQPYIELWNGRAVIRRTLVSTEGYTIERATNWRELEDDAHEALKLVDRPVIAVTYPCPPRLAALARFSRNRGSDWISVEEAQRITGLTTEDLQHAINRGFLDIKTAASGDPAGDRHMLRRTQVKQVWSVSRTSWVDFSMLRSGAEEDAATAEALLKATFWTHVEVSTRENCWPWEGQRDSRGNGRFRLHGRLAPAHRIAYTLAHGLIPPSKQIRHTCSNKLCVNPAHLKMIG